MFCDLPSDGGMGGVGGRMQLFASQDASSFIETAVLHRAKSHTFGLSVGRRSLVGERVGERVGGWVGGVSEVQKWMQDKFGHACSCTHPRAGGGGGGGGGGGVGGV